MFFFYVCAICMHACMWTMGPKHVFVDALKVWLKPKMDEYTTFKVFFFFFSIQVFVSQNKNKILM